MALEIWRRLKKNKMAMLGLTILVMLALTAIFADVIADYDTKVIAQDIPNRLQGPSMEHWCGTDEFGRDIFARLVHGSRVSLVVGLISVSISLFIGGALGAIAGYYGGRVDNVIMRIMDIFLAVPSILLAMTIVAALGTSPGQRDAGHRCFRCSGLCANCPCVCYEYQGSGVCRGITRHWCEEPHYDFPRDSSELSGSDYCSGNPVCSRCNPVYRILKLYRPGSTAAVSGVGRQCCPAEETI